MQFYLSITQSLLLFFCFQFCMAQDGEITGKITDQETGEPVLFANVYVEVDGLPRGTQSDLDGFYSLKPIPPGTYTLTVSTIDYGSKKVTDIAVVADRTIVVDIEMHIEAKIMEEVVIMEYKAPLINEDNGSGGTVTSKEIANLPTRDVSSIAAPAAGVYQNDKGKALNVKGTRSNGKDVYIDGVRVRGNKSSNSKKKKSKQKSKPSKQAPKETTIAESPTVEQAQKVQHNLLTAGEVHDFSKWEMWGDISADILASHRQTWNIYPKERYALQLTNESRFPLVDRKVILKNTNGEILWEAKTDNLGKAELWLNLFEGQKNKAENLLIEVIGKETVEQVFDPKPYQEGINYVRLDESCQQSKNLDVMLVVDATGSMSDEISYLKSDFTDVMETVEKTHKSLKINWGSLFYRAYGNANMIEPTDFTEDTDAAIATIQAQEAKNGGLEALDEAMLQAVRDMSWRDDAVSRVLFLIADEPPPSNSTAKMREVCEIAARKGIRIVPVASSGLDKSTEYLMRAMALASNGTYTFLTDDSGIGDSHIKPTTDEYKVETLNGLLLRFSLPDDFWY